LSGDLNFNLGITKYKAKQYADPFETAFVFMRIFPAGTNVLREPKVLLVPPVRLLHRTPDEAAGGLREDFFALALRQAGIPLHYLKSTLGEKMPDFLVEYRDSRIAFEIGGRGKGRSQFKGVKADRKIILAPMLPRLPAACLCVSRGSLLKASCKKNLGVPGGLSAKSIPLCCHGLSGSER